MKIDLARRLAIRFSNGYDQDGGDRHIVRALRKPDTRAVGAPVDFDALLSKAWQMRDALPQAISIDNYIDAREDPDIALLGKLAIASAIRDSEKGSNLALSERDERVSMLERVSGTFYDRLFQLLSEGLRQSNASTIFDACGFVSFNYDRSLEWFFTHALANYFALSDQEAQSIVSKMQIVHPYGTLGNLTWNGSNGPFMRNGHRESNDLSELAASIRTFTEQISDESLRTKISGLVNRADHIVFLGFGFHDINMQTLATKNADSLKRVFGTALGVSQSDVDVIKRSITVTFQSTRRALRVNNVELRNDLRCGSIFDEYARSLRS